MKQESFSDMEYRCRKKKTKREEFLEIMDEIIPWDEWISLIVPYYPAGKRGRPPIEIEIMLRMYLLQCWFTLSDEGVEDAIYDSYRRMFEEPFMRNASIKGLDINNHNPFWGVPARQLLMKIGMKVHKGPPFPGEKGPVIGGGLRYWVQCECA